MNQLEIIVVIDDNEIIFPTFQRIIPSFLREIPLAYDLCSVVVFGIVFFKVFSLPSFYKVLFVFNSFTSSGLRAFVRNCNP